MVNDDDGEGSLGGPAIAATTPLPGKTTRLLPPETAESDLPGPMVLSDLPGPMVLGNLPIREPHLARTVRLEAGPPAPDAPPPAPFGDTVTLGEHAKLPGTSVLPFKETTSPWATLPVPPRQDRPCPDPAPTGTITLSQEEQLMAGDRPHHPFPEEPPAGGRPAPPSWGRIPSPLLGSELAAASSSEAITPPAWIGTTPPVTMGAPAPKLAVTMGASGPKSPEAGIALEHPPSLAVALLPVASSPGGKLLTVIAKATSDLLPRAPARLRPESDPLPADVHTDFGQAKLRSDVTLVGHACAAPVGARSGEVSFRFGHPNHGFHRRIAVFGDRRWVRRGRLPEISAPEPFDQVPLRYERAFGGPGYSWNPVGVGFDATPGSALPNLEDPDHLIRSLASAPRPACFAPIPPAWEGGARHQAAPRSQQLPFLQGDEPFTITGMLPGGAVIEGRLPGLRVRALARKAHRPEPAAELAVRLETVSFDTDAMTLHLFFRGTLEVPVGDTTDLGIASLLMMAEDLAGPVARPM